MRVHPAAYSEVLSQLIIKVAVKTKRDSCPSDIDDDGWRNIHALKTFKDYGEDPRKSLAAMTKKSQQPVIQ